MLKIFILLIGIIYSSTLTKLHLSEEKPTTPRIEYIIPLHEQPQQNASETIWYDDFNTAKKIYAEGGNLMDYSVSYGGFGKSMLCYYQKGKQGKGGGKVFFGDAPTYQDKKVRENEKFDEIYWRIYVKHEHGWIGAPKKMSRATSIVNNNWAQAMIAHVWSGAGNSLTLNPV